MQIYRGAEDFPFFFSFSFKSLYISLGFLLHLVSWMPKNTKYQCEGLRVADEIDAGVMTGILGLVS